jgi:hypothetical protein
MANYTLTYSPMLEGWTSFHSYYPEWMTNMNNFLYTFKSGELWKHNTNATRNSWYGAASDPSTVTVVFNDAPSESKMFKTLACETDSPWKTTITTDLNSGVMEASYFELKEGDYFTYIRRNPDTIDLKAMSTQGIGSASSVTLISAGNYRINFTFDIGTTVSIGDTIYIGAVGGLTISGIVTAHNATSVTINIVVGGTVPVAGNFIVFVKNAVAESYGARGYYMQVLLENTSSTAVELFAISSQVFKSYP